MGKRDSREYLQAQPTHLKNSTNVFFPPTFSFPT